MHDRIVDRVLQATAQEGMGSTESFILRFDVMILFVSAALRHLHTADPPDTLRAQMLWEITFEGLEESLRSRGVSDLRMASRMRKLLQNAMGRRNAYLKAWDEPEAMRAAIARNVFNGADAGDPRVDMLLTHLSGLAASVLEPTATP
ncbi:MAG: ubiquinol-cytochrome C chaperone family protein [Magnetococcales bacterium]|nr:ubiquinol-cytochrome C chaperone family protein [Magnetococcales bacterium]